METLIAKRERCLPIPLVGVKRRGRFRTLPRHVSPSRSGWIWPLWTASRFDKAAASYDDALIQWRGRMAGLVSLVGSSQRSRLPPQRTPGIVPTQSTLARLLEVGAPLNWD